MVVKVVNAISAHKNPKNAKLCKEREPCRAPGAQVRWSHPWLRKKLRPQPGSCWPWVLLALVSAPAAPQVSASSGSLLKSIFPPWHTRVRDGTLTPEAAWDLCMGCQGPVWPMSCFSVRLSDTSKCGFRKVFSHSFFSLLFNFFQPVDGLWMELQEQRQHSPPAGAGTLPGQEFRALGSLSVESHPIYSQLITQLDAEV